MPIGAILLLVTAAFGPLSAQTHENYYRMKKVTNVDVQYNRNTGCHPDIVRLTFRATSPDGRFAIEMFPDRHWQWSGDPQMVRLLPASNQQMAQYGRKSCDLMAPMDATEYLKRFVAPGVRRGARVTGVEPMPEMPQQLQQQARRDENAAAIQGMRVQVRTGVARLRLDSCFRCACANERG